MKSSAMQSSSFSGVYSTFQTQALFERLSVSERLLPQITADFAVKQVSRSFVLTSQLGNGLQLQQSEAALHRLHPAVDGFPVLSVHVPARSKLLSIQSQQAGIQLLAAGTEVGI